VNKHDTIIHDCNPPMADVVEKLISRPREPKPSENRSEWLVGKNYQLPEATPAWRHFCYNYTEFQKRWPMVEHRPDLAPPQYMGVPRAHTFLVTWEEPPHDYHQRLLCLNEDGTRYALIDLAAVIAQIWAREELAANQPPGKRGPKPKPLNELSPSQIYRRVGSTRRAKE
jgi:hypothetical protein